MLDTLSLERYFVLLYELVTGSLRLSVPPRYNPNPNPHPYPDPNPARCRRATNPSSNAIESRRSPQLRGVHVHRP